MGWLTFSLYFGLFLTSAYCYTCSDFVEGACDLSENNIVSHDRFTNSAVECQQKCRLSADCVFFTHFDTQCYLLSQCGEPEICTGCTSGPNSPDLSSCPWPPGPSPDTTTTTPAPATTTTAAGPSGCEDFEMGTCELNENNIVSSDRNTPTPGACQDKCGANPDCHWFTHYDTSCYLLDHCGTLSNCETCVSGPPSPDVDSCPWPPHPTQPTTSSTLTAHPQSTTTAPPPPPTTTTAPPPPPTTSRTPLIPTTTTVTDKPTSRTPLVPTTTTEKNRTPLVTTTTPKPTTTTTKAPTPTSVGGCDEIRVNEECDWNYGLLHWYENVMTGAACQDKCKTVNGAQYFSHYNEGAHAEHGFCGCFSQCAWPTSEGCHQTCSSHQTHEIGDLFTEEEAGDLESAETFGGELEAEPSLNGQPRPGPRYCHCMHGPLSPDVDGCNIWP